MAEKGADAFYTGKTAQQMVDLINERGGCFALSDFSEYRPKYRQVLHSTYHGTDVVSFGPPSGGCAVLEMLNILETQDVQKTGQNTAATIHALAEAMKLGLLIGARPWEIRILSRWIRTV